jgi:PAS domain S-box-containing protein
VKLDEKLFRLMAEQVTDYAVFLLDTTGHIISWNLGAQKIKGYAPDEIIGKHFSIFYPDEALRVGWPQTEIEAATREGRFEDEGFRVRKDGSRFWANVVITALRDENGRLLGFSKITRDLTERRQYEESLRQSEERFRLLVEGVQDYAIYMLDPQGIITSWNSGAERVKGYSRHEIIGKHFSNFYLPEDIKAGKPWAELAVARREGRAEDEGWRVRKNGERFWARVVVTSLHDGAGHLRGFAKVTQDLSQRRHVQELEVAANKLNEFIAMLAHEIRNPLAPIRNALSVMNGSPADASVQATMRAVIDRQAARLSHIAEDMIDISRITRGALAIERKPVDLAELLEQSLECAAPEIEAGKHRLRIEHSEENLAVLGDMQRLTQVFVNLLSNAARYTPPGGTISLRTWRADESVFISVRDTGRGIPAGSLRSIFQMFVQDRTPIDRVGEGLGVGLAVARNIVELHGGTIEVKSEGEGKGSEFTVRLLAAPASTGAASKRTEAPRAMPRAASRKVLVVDDNADAAETLEMLLQVLGHKTRVASDGPKALQLFSEFHPDIVLLDIGLPGMNGYEVARRLRAQEGQGLRIVAVTGWGQAEDRKQSAEAGFDLHLVKPVEAEQLQAILASAGDGTVN